MSLKDKPHKFKLLKAKFLMVNHHTGSLRQASLNTPNNHRANLSIANHLKANLSTPNNPRGNLNTAKFRKGNLNTANNPRGNLSMAKFRKGNLNMVFTLHLCRQGPCLPTAPILPPSDILPAITQPRTLPHRRHTSHHHPHDRVLSSSAAAQQRNGSIRRAKSWKANSGPCYRALRPLTASRRLDSNKLDRRSNTDTSRPLNNHLSSEEESRGRVLNNKVRRDRARVAPVSPFVWALSAADDSGIEGSRLPVANRIGSSSASQRAGTRENFEVSSEQNRRERLSEFINAAGAARSTIGLQTGDARVQRSGPVQSRSLNARAQRLQRPVSLARLSAQHCPAGGVQVVRQRAAFTVSTRATHCCREVSSPRAAKREVEVPSNSFPPSSALTAHFPSSHPPNPPFTSRQPSPSPSVARSAQLGTAEKLDVSTSFAFVFVFVFTQIYTRISPVALPDVSPASPAPRRPRRTLVDPTSPLSQSIKRLCTRLDRLHPQAIPL
ncbi:hypothetical protein G7046_g9667 [Stylonectria norvegica]|nr:hypothetical protein G7046_g9667 [Stylonectria norvegica]